MRWFLAGKGLELRYLHTRSSGKTRRVVGQGNARSMECVLRMEEEEANGKANQVSLLLKVVVFCVCLHTAWELD